jgi:hypothetical protein
VSFSPLIPLVARESWLTSWFRSPAGCARRQTRECRGPRHGVDPDLLHDGINISPKSTKRVFGFPNVYDSQAVSAVSGNENEQARDGPVAQ